MNEALRQLGEEHRLGMIQAGEFRKRRRDLLGSWGDVDATTAPGSHRPSQTTTQANPHVSRMASASVEPERSSRPRIAGVVLGVVVMGVASWMLLRPAKGPLPGSTSPPAVQRSAQLAAVMQEATAFRNRNSWEAGDTDAFLGKWRALSYEDRKAAQEEPSLRSLVYELEQNIAAERQALEYSPSAEGQERLERLRAFARELTEAGS